MTPQNRQILAHLQSGRTITPMIALRKYGVFRLGARIYDLRQDGHVINRAWEVTPDGKRFARYSLIKEAEQTAMRLADE